MPVATQPCSSSHWTKWRPYPWLIDLCFAIRFDLTSEIWTEMTNVPVQASLVAQTVKNLPANEGDPGLIPGLGRSHGEGNHNPLQSSYLGNPMDRGAGPATVHGIA